MADKPIRITRAIQTSSACPSQWDLWDADENYFYARFRHGGGAVIQFQNENWLGVEYPEGEDITFINVYTSNPLYIRHVAVFQTEDDWDGFISLEEFAVRTGLELAPDIYSVGFGDHLRDELIKQGMTMFLEGEGDPPDE
jgi:hypothetical protein